MHIHVKEHLVWITDVKQKEEKLLLLINPKKSMMGFGCEWNIRCSTSVASLNVGDVKL